MVVGNEIVRRRTYEGIIRSRVGPMKGGDGVQRPIDARSRMEGLATLLEYFQQDDHDAENHGDRQFDHQLT